MGAFVVKAKCRTAFSTGNLYLLNSRPIFLSATNKSQKAIIDEYFYDLLVAALVIEARLRHSDVNLKSIVIKLLA
jgi:hypothetical protein